MKSMPPTLISSNPEIMGGAWCISGTRIPAKAIWSFRDQGYDLTGFARNTPAYAMTRFMRQSSSRSQSQ